MTTTRERSPQRDGARPVWIFGYGSLVWRVDFPYAQSALAWIEGYTRRFWQGSTDHRGLPESPGRVVTLVEEPGARTLGVAYRLDPESQNLALEHLDYRERGGYDRLDVPLNFLDTEAGASATRGIVYLANASNPNYLGPAALPEIARQIHGAVGPSGPNPEYLYELARFLRSHDEEEPHVFALETLVRRRAAGNAS